MVWDFGHIHLTLSLWKIPPPLYLRPRFSPHCWCHLTKITSSQELCGRCGWRRLAGTAQRCPAQENPTCPISQEFLISLVFPASHFRLFSVTFSIFQTLSRIFPRFNGVFPAISLMISSPSGHAWACHRLWRAASARSWKVPTSQAGSPGCLVRLGHAKTTDFWWVSLWSTDKKHPKTMEDRQFWWVLMGLIYYKWEFSIAMWVYQRVRRYGSKLSGSFFWGWLWCYTWVFLGGLVR